MITTRQFSISDHPFRRAVADSWSVVDDWLSSPKPATPGKIPGEPGSKRPRKSNSKFSLGAARVLEDGALEMSLEELCDFIVEHRSFRDGAVVSCSTYQEPIMWGIVHRFLVLHLRRVDNPDIWIRLDRRTVGVHGLQRLNLVLGREITAHDTVRLALQAPSLVDEGAKEENFQVYHSPPLLRDFRSILLAVVETLDTYRLYDRNCWLFASALQESLEQIGLGEYRRGVRQNGDLSRDSRKIIWDCALLKYSGTFASSSDDTATSGMNPGSNLGAVFTLVQRRFDGSWQRTDLNPHEPAVDVGRFLVDPVNLKVTRKPLYWKGREARWYAVAKADSPSYALQHPLIVPYKRGDVLAIFQRLQGTRWWIGLVGSTGQLESRHCLALRMFRRKPRI